MSGGHEPHSGLILKIYMAWLTTQPGSAEINRIKKKTKSMKNK